MHSILIDGQWTRARSPSDTIVAVNPANGETSSERYPVSSWDDLDRALTVGAQVAPQIAVAAPERLASFLEAVATEIESRADDLIAAAAWETGLPETPRLRVVELPRTASQLRHVAGLCREGSFRQAVIDTKANVRSAYEPLRAPVAIFGPNNFPFAFNAVGGGDFATAIAAGNPVIAKAHPGHPKTTRLLAEAVHKALLQSDLPVAAVQMLYHFEAELGLRLVADSRVGATAFTGGRQSGLALKAAADAAGKPVYLELSSVNPVFILPGAMAERSVELSAELAGSCALGAGQFCTNPGISIIVKSAESDDFVARVGEALQTAPNSTLLNAQVLRGIEQGVAALREAGARLLVGGAMERGTPLRYQNTLLTVTAQQFCAAPAALQREVFGAVHLVVVADDFEGMLGVARLLDGNLTGCIYSAREGADDAQYERLSEILLCKVGRLLNDKMPTGVAVSPAMNHGGPFPSSGHPGFSSVGHSSALRRFTALRCYDAVRPERLPAALRDDNPLGLRRSVDGEWTDRAI